jgi:hypothetical protein
MYTGYKLHFGTHPYGISILLDPKEVVSIGIEDDTAEIGRHHCGWNSCVYELHSMFHSLCTTVRADF